MTQIPQILAVGLHDIRPESQVHNTLWRMRASVLSSPQPCARSGRGRGLISPILVVCGRMGGGTKRLCDLLSVEKGWNEYMALADTAQDNRQKMSNAVMFKVKA